MSRWPSCSLAVGRCSLVLTSVQRSRRRGSRLEVLGAGSSVLGHESGESQLDDLYETGSPNEGVQGQLHGVLKGRSPLSDSVVDRKNTRRGKRGRWPLRLSGTTNGWCGVDSGCCYTAGSGTSRSCRCHAWGAASWASCKHNCSRSMKTHSGTEKNSLVRLVWFFNRRRVYKITIKMVKIKRV